MKIYMETQGSKYGLYFILEHSFISLKEFLKRKNLSSMSHGKGFYNQGRPRQRTQHPRRNTKQMPPSQ